MAFSRSEMAFRIAAGADAPSSRALTRFWSFRFSWSNCLRNAPTSFGAAVDAFFTSL